VNRRLLYATLALVLGSSLAACGGGSSPTPTVSATPTATATATASPIASTANLSGTVVDFDTNTGLAGVPVKLAPWTHGAAPTTIATTAPNGSFAFSTAPGHYLLVIGNDSPTDTRASIHAEITPGPGNDSLVQGVPSTQTNVTLTPAQLSGNFRLATLSNTATSQELQCLTEENALRATAGVIPVTEDETILEFARDDVQQMTALDALSTPILSTYAYNALGYAASDNRGGSLNCTDAETTTIGGARPAAFLSPSATWFAASWQQPTYPPTTFFGEGVAADPR
jgi:hypothetical protein